MVALTNLRLPATWTTASPDNPAFDISANELDDDLEIVGDLDLGAFDLTATDIGATNFKANDGTASFSIADSTGVLTMSANFDIAGNSIINTGTLTLPTSTDTIVGRATTDTLTNKTLTSPVLTTPEINDTSADHQYVFAVSELVADRTVTLPLLTGNDSFVFEAHTQTLTNKTLTAPTITSPVLTTPEINDTSADHQYIFGVSELVADRTVTLPLLTGNDTFVFNDFAATLTNKTIAFGSNTLTNVMSLTTAQSVTAGIKKTFSQSATTAGFNLGAVSAAPSAPAEGDVWYQGSDDSLAYRQAATTRTIANLTEAQTLTNKTIAFASNTLTNVMSLTTAQTVTAGIKKTLSQSATTAGLNLGAVSAAPSAPAEGDVWYQGSNDALAFRDAAATRQVATLDNSQTLTNKTLGTGTVFSVIPTVNDGIKFTFNPNATVTGLNVGAHTADASAPVNGDIFYNSTTNKFRAYENGAWVNAIGAGATLPVADTTSIVEGSADPTKEIRFEVDGLTTGTVRVITPPDANITLVNTASGLISNSNVSSGIFTAITGIGTQTQALNMNSNLINSVTDPVSAQDAATKNFVETVSLLKSGGIMTGNIDMDVNAIDFDAVADATVGNPLTGDFRLYHSSETGAMVFKDSNGLKSPFNSSVSTYTITVSSGTYTARKSSTGVTVSSGTDLEVVVDAVLSDKGTTNPASIEFGEGTFTWTSRPVFNDHQDLTIKGQGMGVTKWVIDSSVAATNAVFTFQKSTSLTYYNLAAVSYGDTSLSFAADLGEESNFSIGDWVNVISDDDITAVDANGENGIFLRVSDTETTGNGVLQLYGTVNESDLTTTPRVAVLDPIENLTISNLEIIDQRASSGGEYTLDVIAIYHHFNVKIENVRFTDCRRGCCQHIRCNFVKITGCDINRPLQYSHDLTAGESSISTANQASHQNYGFSVSSCENVTISNCTGHYCRHFVTGTFGNSNDIQGKTRNLTIMNNTFIDTTSAHLDCHEGCDGVIISGNALSGSIDTTIAIIGIACRSGATVTNNTITGVGRGIQVFNEQASGSTQTNPTIITGNNIVHRLYGVIIRNEVKNCIISNNRFIGATADVGVFLERIASGPEHGGDNTIISNNYFEGDGSTNSYGIQGNGQLNNVISGNMFNNLDFGIIYTDTDTRTDFINVLGNIFEACTTNISITGNANGSTATQNLDS